MLVGIRLSMPAIGQHCSKLSLTASNASSTSEGAVGAVARARGMWSSSSWCCFLLWFKHPEPKAQRKQRHTNSKFQHPPGHPCSQSRQQLNPDGNPLSNGSNPVQTIRATSMRDTIDKGVDALEVASIETLEGLPIALADPCQKRDIFRIAVVGMGSRHGFASLQDRLGPSVTPWCLSCLLFIA